MIVLRLKDWIASNRYTTHVLTEERYECLNKKK